MAAQRSGAPAAQRPSWRSPRLWLGAVLALLLATVGYQQLAVRLPQPQARQLTAQGRDLFARHCAVCHGAHMEGKALPGSTAAPPLNKPGFRVFFALLPAGMQGWVAEQIGDGNAVMPRFRDVLSDDERRALAVFIRRVNTGAEAAP